MAVKTAHGVGPPRKLQPQYSHAKRLAFVLRFHTPQPHELFVGYVELIPQRPQVFLDQMTFETVVAGRNGTAIVW